MYNTNSLRSKSSKRRRLFSLKNRENSLSITAIDDFPYSVSKWGSQVSLYSTLSRSGTLSSTPCSLFQRSSTGIWNSFDAETDIEYQEKDGKTIMKVHNADRTYKSILLNDDMRVGEICEIMLDKNHRRDSIVHWQIFEEPGDFPGFERQVEDHEFAMDLQRRWPAAVAPSRIWFRHNRKKYSFNKDLDRILSLKDATLRGDMLYPNILFLGVSEGVVMLKRPQGKWSKVFCFLVMSTIFFSKRHFGYSKKKSKYLLDLTTMDVYVPQEKTNVIKLLHTPTPHTLLLVPSSIGLLDPEAIFAIGCKTRQSMLAWAEGLRFHKHGQRKLSENLENALNHRFSPQVEATKQNGSPINERTIESVNDQIITNVNRPVVNKESSRSNENGNRSGTMNPRAFDFNTETLRLYKQNRSPHQYFFGNDYQSRNENSTTLRRWSAYDPEDNEGYFNFNDNMKTGMNSSVSTLKSGSETKSFTPNTNSGHSFLKQELTSRFSVYEPEDRFEGVVFQSGAPYLLLELPDGLHKYSIEVSQDRSFDEKRYKLPSRSERFESLHDLCNFYEKRRHLLLEDDPQDDSATAF